MDGPRHHSLPSLPINQDGAAGGGVVLIVSLSFVMTGLFPMMFSSELRVAHRVLAKFWRRRSMIPPRRPTETFNSSSSPGLYGCIEGAALSPPALPPHNLPRRCEND